MCLTTRTRTIEVSYSDNRTTFMDRLAGTGGVGRWMVSRSDQRRYVTELLFAGGAHHLWANFGSEGVRNGQRVRLQVTYVSEVQGDSKRVVQLLMEPVRSPPRRPPIPPPPPDFIRQLVLGDHIQREAARQTWWRRIRDAQPDFRHVAPRMGEGRAAAADEVVSNLEGYRNFWRHVIQVGGPSLSRQRNRYAEQGRQRALRLYRQLLRAPPETRTAVLRDPSGKQLLENMDSVIEQATRVYVGR